MTASQGPFDLVLQRKLAAPRALVWRCWTETVLLEQWFCPKPWRATDTVIDLRVGGAFGTIIRGPEGEVFDNAPGCYLEIIPQEKLVWTSALGPEFRPNIIPPEAFGMTVVLTLRDEAGGGTVYTATVLHADADAVQKHEAMGFHQGWGMATTQLEELAQSLR